MDSEIVQVACISAPGSTAPSLPREEVIDGISQPLSPEKTSRQSDAFDLRR